MSARLAKVLRDLVVDKDVHHTLTPNEKTVTTAGTRVALVSFSTLARGATIIAKAGNTGQVYVGDHAVDNTVNDGLDAGEVLNLSLANGFVDLSLVYIDVDTNGEGVDFYYIARDLPALG